MSRKFDRFMVDVNIGTNRKLRRLTVAERLCHIAGILPIAAQAPIRGRLLVGNGEATPEDFAELAGVTVAVAGSALNKLRDVGIVIPDDENLCEQIHDWGDWNPAPKHDETAAERMRRYRDRRNAGRNVTERNAVTVTRGREEKRREEGSSSVSLSSSRRSATDELERQREKASEDDRRLCRLFAELAKDRNPKFRIKSEAEWLRQMRLSREKDGNQASETERLIRWAFTAETRDSQFWAETIQSPANLREHFGQMWGKMTSVPLKAVAPPESPEAFLARRGVA